MAILRVANEPADFDGCGLSYNTTSGRFDSAYVRSCVLGTGYGTSCALEFASVTEAWLNFRGWQAGNAGSFGTAAPAAFVGVNTNAGMRFRVVAHDFSSGDRGLRLQSYTGTTATALGTAWTDAYPLPASAATEITVYFKVHSSTGKFDVYRNGSQILTYTGDTTLSSAVSGFTGFTVYAWDNATTYLQAFSEFIVADEDTRGMRLKRMTVDAAGGNTAWTGAYTDIDDTSVNDADGISSATTSQEVSFGTDCSASGTGTWKALVVSARAGKGTSGPSTLDMGVKTTGNAAQYPANKALTGGLKPVQAVLATNPYTSAAWTNSDLNAVELALRSAT